MLACAATICGPTIVFAEPLFFDCHGTYKHDEAPDFLGEPHNDFAEQVVIDVEKGLVEGPIGGPAKGSNEYCTRE
jgi:hypothetical protein